jgi:hypothetical protein
MFSLIFTPLQLPQHLVLHPRHKLAYFKTAGWEPDWIDTAQELVRDEFKRSYKKEGHRNPEEPSAGMSPTGSKVRFYMSE